MVKIVNVKLEKMKYRVVALFVEIVRLVLDTAKKLRVMINDD